MKVAFAILSFGLLAGLPAGHKFVVRGPNRVAAAGDSVWFWFASCGGPIMTVEVRLDRHLLSQTTTPLCKAPRASVFQDGGQGAVSFSFLPGRRIVWKAYRSNHDTTRATDRITGDLWQAGADSGDMLLGVSFTVPNRIVMNTTHIAHPTKADTSTIAGGVAVITYPGKPRR